MDDKRMEMMSLSLSFFSHALQLCLIYLGFCLIHWEYCTHMGCRRVKSLLSIHVLICCVFAILVNALLFLEVNSIYRTDFIGKPMFLRITWHLCYCIALHHLSNTGYLLCPGKIVFQSPGKQQFWQSTRSNRT